MDERRRLEDQVNELHENLNYINNYNTVMPKNQRTFLQLFYSLPYSIFLERYHPQPIHSRNARS